MSMRKIREVLRLTHELGLSVRQVREATGVGKTAVSEYVSRARVIGITWPIPPEITDAELVLARVPSAVAIRWSELLVEGVSDEVGEHPVSLVRGRSIKLGDAL